MFREIREIKVIKEKSEDEKKLDRLVMELIDCRLYTERWYAIKQEIDDLRAKINNT